MPNDNTAAVAAPPALRALENSPAASAGFTSAAGFALLQRGATLLAASTLVPEVYRDNIANCTVALNMAQRMGADPLMVMQNLYVVHGRPAWSAQFLIACFNQCGRFSAIRYRWQGEVGKDDWGCRAWAIELDTKREIVGPLVTMETAKAEGWLSRAGSKWKTIPELMLTYRAAAWMVRTHAPELAMGLPTAEEVGDIIDVTPMHEAERPSRVDTLKETLRQQEPAKPNPGVDPAPYTYPELAERINQSLTTDGLNDAEALIDDAITDAKQRTELHDLAKARRIELTK